MTKVPAAGVGALQRKGLGGGERKGQAEPFSEWDLSEIPTKHFGN